MTRYFQTLVAGAAVAAAFAGCASKDTPYVISGRDVSCDTCETRNNYDAELDRMLDWAAETEGTIIADVIDGNALASYAERYKAGFKPDPSLGGNKQLIRDDLRAKARKAHGQLRAALADSGQTLGSDPLGFTTAAAPQLANHDDAYLVYASDMIQRAPAVDPLDLYDPPTTDRQIDAVIQRLKAENKIPDLNGVRVIVIGGARSSGAVTADKAITVKKFWLRFFAEARAETVAWGPRFESP